MTNPLSLSSTQINTRTNIRKRSLLHDFWAQRHIQAFALVGVLYLVIFSVIPMSGLLMAFKDFRLQDGFIGIFTSPWVGLRHFRDFVNDWNFTILVRNTIVISVLKLVFTFPIPILLAIMLNEVRNKAAKRIVQTATYMPHFISWVVVSGFAFIFLNTHNGLINDVLVNLGFIEREIPFLANPRAFWPIVVITALWKETGWWAIIFLAALAGVDPTLYEAAQIDGASRMQRIRHITLPSIQPTITVVLILAIGNLLGGGLGGSNFEQSMLLGNIGNRETSDIIQTYVFRIGLSEGRFAFATAVGMIQSVISIILIFFSNLAAKKITGRGLF